MSGYEGVIGAQTEKAVRGNMTPPRGSQPVGSYFDGRTIWRLARKTFKRAVKRDEDGNIFYHLNADGTRRAPQYENVPGEPRVFDFVIDDMGNGMTYINENFAPAAGELEKKQLEAARASNMDRLSLALESANLSIEDIVAVVQGLKATPPAPKEEFVELSAEELAELKARQEAAAAQAEADAKAEAAKLRAANARAARDANKP